jgi:hypothetical protein
MSVLFENGLDRLKKLKQEEQHFMSKQEEQNLNFGVVAFALQ